MDIYNNLIFFEHLKLTEKFSLVWESNHMPLTFWVSTQTATPPRQLLSHCPLSKGLYIDHHCGHIIEVKLKQGSS